MCPKAPKVENQKLAPPPPMPLPSPDPVDVTSSRRKETINNNGKDAVSYRARKG